MSDRIMSSGMNTRGLRGLADVVEVVGDCEDELFGRGMGGGCWRWP